MLQIETIGGRGESRAVVGEEKDEGFGAEFGGGDGRGGGREEEERGRWGRGSVKLDKLTPSRLAPFCFFDDRFGVFFPILLGLFPHLFFHGLFRVFPFFSMGFEKFLT
jgi:hypothetical protein